MLNHVMLDLETWGTSPYSTIITIGACLFDPYTEHQSEIIKGKFEVAIEPVDAGLRVNASTLMWWMDRERDEARREWWHMPKVQLREALDGFSDWLGTVSQRNDLRIWGNGSDFDNTLLAQSYELASREVPWSFRHNRCFRTLRNLCALDEQIFQGVVHTALADAENQAIHTNRIVRWLGIKLT